MREVAVALALVLCAAPRASGTLWLGRGSETGPVELPAEYLQIVASLEVQRFDFNALGAGSDQTRRDLGGFILVNGSPEVGVVAQAGPVAGAQPSSPPIALLVTGPASAPVCLSLELVDPVRTVGFVLMGLGSPATVKVYDQDLRFVADYTIPALPPGYRRWMGVAEPGCDLGKITLEPLGNGDYGIDDVELGVELPEPECLAILIWASLVHARRRPTRINGRAWFGCGRFPRSV